MNTTTKKSIRRTLRGIVMSAAMNKTIVVRVTRARWHPKYRRQYRISKKFKVHDEHNAYKVGDMVECVETRPISKEKRWRVVKKVVIV